MPSTLNQQKKPTTSKKTQKHSENREKRSHEDQLISDLSSLSEPSKTGVIRIEVDSRRR